MNIDKELINKELINKDNILMLLFIGVHSYSLIHSFFCQALFCDDLLLIDA